MQRLRKLREQLHLSQKEVAQIINKTPQAYSLYEQGKRSPDVETLIRLSDLFHVSIDYLLGHEVSQPEPSTPTSEPTDIKQLIAQELPNMDAEDAAMMGQFMQFLKLQRNQGSKAANGNV